MEYDNDSFIRKETTTSGSGFFSNELSVITDPYGRVLASMDFFTTGERVIVAQVPTGHVVFTIYSVIGDLVGWLSVTGLIVMIGLAFLGGRKAASVSTPPMERPLPV